MGDFVRISYHKDELYIFSQYKSTVQMTLKRYSLAKQKTCDAQN